MFFSPIKTYLFLLHYYTKYLEVSTYNNFQVSYEHENGAQ